MSIEKKLEDVNQKIAIATRIVRGCSREKAKGKKFDTTKILPRAAFYTGIRIERIQEINANRKPVRTPNYFYLHKDKDSAFFQAVREILVEQYVKNGNIATNKFVLDTLYKKGCTNKENMIKILKNIGFTWYPILKHIYIVIEKPESTFARNRFLGQIQQYRKEGRPIIYLEDRDVQKILKKFNYDQGGKRLLIAVSYASGLIDAFFVYDTNEKRNIDSILQAILPNFPPSSVVIIENNEDHWKNLCSLPTINSAKHQMLDWLNQNNIPHDPEMHRADLLKLINEFKKNCCVAKYKIDEVLIGHGHVVLRRPRALDMLNYYYQPIWEKLMTANAFEGRKLGIDQEERLLNYLKSFTLANWREFENNLIETERKIYEEDAIMEEVIDGIMTLHKYKGIDISDLDYEHISDEIYVNKIKRYTDKEKYDVVLD